MHGFGSIEEIESCLAELSKGDAPLVKILAARPGQKERRYVQLLSAESLPCEPASETFAPAAVGEQAAVGESGPRVEALEKEVAGLKAEMQQLREEFSAFRQQFD